MTAAKKKSGSRKFESLLTEKGRTRILPFRFFNILKELFLETLKSPNIFVATAIVSHVVITGKRAVDNFVEFRVKIFAGTIRVH